MQRICMWSGPRNLSTTMMRCFGGRSDTICTDEPFYATFLKATGLDHPMADEIIEAGDTDPKSVCSKLQQNTVSSSAYWYQKHMCHHMLEGIPRDFMDGAIHIFLIRDPRRVIASWIKKNPKLSFDEVAVKQQCDLYQYVSDRYGVPPVIDTDDLLIDPRKYLKQLCSKIDIPWDEGMLKWNAGPHTEDGIWGKVWYDSVWRSTGFGPPADPSLPGLSTEFTAIANQAMPYYNRMKAAAL